MNKKLKAEIKEAFNIPTPIKKNEFFQMNNFSETKRFDFIISQIRYIRKRVWIISCLLVIVTLYLLHKYNDDSSYNTIRIVSSILPFISLITITELARSTSHNMEELEMSCKHKLASIILARLGILCIFNTAIFGLIFILLLNQVNFGILPLGLYLLIPFMLNCSLSLFVINRLHFREVTYVCGCISCFIGLLNAIFSFGYKIMFTNEYLPYWNMIFIILIIWVVLEVLKLIKKTEELQWNLL